MKIMAVSGSPVKNSNVDRTVQAIMEASGLEGDFIKLSRYNIKPCLACLKCAKDNYCVQKDDYSGTLEGMLKEADALIIGSYPTFASPDAGTKTFCERTYSLRHNQFLTRGKLAVGVAGGYKANQQVEDWLKLFFKAQGMDLVGTMQTCGNTTCLSCGFGETCSISNVKIVFGENISIEEGMFKDFDQDPELRDQAEKLGKSLRAKLEAQRTV